MSDALIQYVIYCHPQDFPAHYVVRRWVITPGHCDPERVACLCRTLEEARAIPDDLGLYCLPQQAGDDPVIVEVWT